METQPYIMNRKQFPRLHYFGISPLYNERKHGKTISRRQEKKRETNTVFKSDRAIMVKLYTTTAHNNRVQNDVDIYKMLTLNQG